MSRWPAESRAPTIAEQPDPLEPLEYLRILRRRKWFVALAVLVGVVAGWVSAPGHSTKAPPSYRATHTLILNLAINVRQYNIDQAAVLVTSGAVPQAVAAKLGPGSDPVVLAGKVSASPNAAVAPSTSRLTTEIRTSRRVG